MAVFLSGCGGSESNASKEKKTKSGNGEEVTLKFTYWGSGDEKKAIEESVNNFMEKYPNVKVNKLALDFDRGLYIYEVEGYDDTNKYELKIEPVDGEILKEEQKQRDDNDTEGEITIENVNKIQELMDKALKDAGNGYKVDEWELKFENGQSIFEIEVVDDNDHDIEYKYNINTMELIEKDQ